MNKIYFKEVAHPIAGTAILKSEQQARRFDVVILILKSVGKAGRLETQAGVDIAILSLKVVQQPASCKL